MSDSSNDNQHPDIETPADDYEGAGMGSEPEDPLPLVVSPKRFLEIVRWLKNGDSLKISEGDVVRDPEGEYHLREDAEVQR